MRGGSLKHRTSALHEEIAQVRIAALADVAKAVVAPMPRICIRRLAGSESRAWA